MTSWIEVAKKPKPEPKFNSNDNNAQEIFDLPQLDLHEVKNQLKFDRVKNKIDVFSGTTKSKQNIQKFAFSGENFDIYCNLLSNYNEHVYKFLKQLLKTGQFYIGGSFATIFAHFLFGESVNLGKYNESDIDIFCISNYKEDKLDLLLKSISQDLILKEQCIIHKTDILMNIIFKSEELRKIQIIFQVKKSIDEHLSLIDLPLTEFTIGFQKNKFIMYYTQLSLFSLYKKINFVFEPKTNITNNRILKYNDRGFISVFVKNGELCKICDINKKNISDWLDLKQNTSLDILVNNIDEYIDMVNKNIQFEKSDNLEQREQSQFVWFLFKKNMVEYSETEKIVNIYENEAYVGYRGILYTVKKFIKSGPKIIAHLKKTVGKKHNYKEDESMQNFKNAIHNHNAYFGRKSMTPFEFVSDKKKLFFTHVVESFINKQGVFVSNGIFCTEKIYKQNLIDKFYDEIYQEEFTKKNTKRNSKRRKQ